MFPVEPRIHDHLKLRRKHIFGFTSMWCEWLMFSCNIVVQLKYIKIYLSHLRKTATGNTWVEKSPLRYADWVRLAWILIGLPMVDVRNWDCCERLSEYMFEFSDIHDIPMGEDMNMISILFFQGSSSHLDDFKLKHGCETSNQRVYVWVGYHP